MSASDDVGIIGIGIHPFGRHPGVSGLQMAATAARRALADAGVGWGQIDFAAGGSDAAGNADTSVAALGLAPSSSSRSYTRQVLTMWPPIASSPRFIEVLVSRIQPASPHLIRFLSAMS